MADYPDELSAEILEEAEIELVSFDKK
ncbi:MAG: hypothetical protein [Bacteriophage sp.]|nr:MAG: hypothetical protein [Bacteriophage sp.]